MNDNWTDMAVISANLIKERDYCVIQRKCPYCGRYSDKVNSGMGFDFYKFCPHCGRKVKGTS